MRVKNFFLNLIILIGLLQMINCTSKKYDQNIDSFKIIFWKEIGESLNEDRIEEKYLLTLEDILKKKPYYILTSKYIRKYYWDEQFIVVDWEGLVKDGYSPSVVGYFTVVYNDKIIFHGHNHTEVIARIFPRDESPYPAIQLEENNKEVIFFVLKPRFQKFGMTFKDYNKKEKETILNKEILKYFEKQGKIVRGFFDINEIKNQ